VLVGVMTFQRGNPYAFNSGDALIRLEAIYIALSPCGAALSLDRRRTAGSFWSAQVRAPWVIRLMQVQMTLIYVFSVLNKLSGDTWRDGTAISYALRMTDIGNVSFPESIVDNAPLMNVATWSTLALELAIGVLVWNARARPKVLAAGVMFHAALLLTFGIAFFSFAMCVLYVAFLSPDLVSSWQATHGGSGGSHLDQPPVGRSGDERRDALARPPDRTEEQSPGRPGAGLLARRSMVSRSRANDVVSDVRL
jgi:hypothetical protein